MKRLDIGIMYEQEGNDHSIWCLMPVRSVYKLTVGGTWRSFFLPKDPHSSIKLNPQTLTGVHIQYEQLL